MSIYTDVKQIEDAIDVIAAGSEDGGIDLGALSNLINARNETIAAGLETLCKIRANRMAQIMSMKKESVRISDRAKRLERQVFGLEEYILDVLKMSGQKKIDAGTFTVGTRRSARVVIAPGFYNPEFERRETVVSVDKKLLGDALKSGRDIPGAFLEFRDNLAIK